MPMIVKPITDAYGCVRCPPRGAFQGRTTPAGLYGLPMRGIPMRGVKFGMVNDVIQTSIWLEKKFPVSAGVPQAPWPLGSISGVRFIRRVTSSNMGTTSNQVVGGQVEFRFHISDEWKLTEDISRPTALTRVARQYGAGGAIVTGKSVSVISSGTPSDSGGGGGGGGSTPAPTPDGGTVAPVEEPMPLWQWVLLGLAGGGAVVGLIAATRGGQGRRNVRYRPRSRRSRRG